LYWIKGLDVGSSKEEIGGTLPSGEPISCETWGPKADPAKPNAEPSKPNPEEAKEVTGRWKWRESVPGSETGSETASGQVPENEPIPGSGSNSAAFFFFISKQSLLKKKKSVRHPYVYRKYTQENHSWLKKKPRKQPPRQNLENKEPTKILPAKETK
jgi:hypothetical protein